MNAVVVTFDCLPLRLLGCYGNLWIRTPNFDRLAAESIVFHQHYAAWTGPHGVGMPWWSADPLQAVRKSLTVGPAPDDDSAALRSLRNAGVRTLWRSECRDRRRLPADRPFESRAVFLGTESYEGTIEETPWAQLVDDAARLIPRLGRSVRSPWILWLQSQGIPIPWTAPKDWALKYLEAEDADDDRETARTLRRLSDPASSASWTADEWKFARGLCGGYISMLDASLGALLDSIDTLEGEATPLVIVSAGRGIMLAPRAGLPMRYAPLMSEVCQTPLFVRLPNGTEGARHHDLCQSSDLWPTLLEWFGQPASPSTYRGKSLLPNVLGHEVKPREEVFTAAPGSILARRTPHQAVFLTLEKTGGPSAVDIIEPQLFEKPSDLWETLDVASSYPDEVAQQSEQLKSAIA